MSYILHFLLFGLIAMIFAETPSEIDRVKERLQSSAKELSMTTFLKPSDAASYINNDLIKNSPHKINLTKELTKIIQDWSPRFLAHDPTCPYYFSKFNNPSSPTDDLNLLSYLQAIESNQTLAYPFINVLPQSYRNALPLLSIFRCSEFIYSTSNPFFYNIELIIGPGKTELSLERQSNIYSQLYCSLYGWPYFVLVNQTKQPTITYDAQTLLSQDNLNDVDFFLTSLAPGTCLFIPSDWVTGVQLNNSISLLFTLKKIEKSNTNKVDDEPLPCTKTGQSTLENIEFIITDTFNISNIGLIVYFYQYLNPPIFDKQYTTETFFNHFQDDKNASQLVIKWTSELTDLIKNTLFKQLDINHDEIFSVDDYFDIKQSNLNQLQNSIYDILEKLRQIVLEQYNELNEIITKLIQRMGNVGLDDNNKQILEAMLKNLPDHVKEKLKEKNINIRELLDKVKVKKSKKSSTNKQYIKEDDDSILVDKKQDVEIPITVDEDQEEITADSENEFYRIDL